MANFKDVQIKQLHNIFDAIKIDRTFIQRKLYYIYSSRNMLIKCGQNKTHIIFFP